MEILRNQEILEWAQVARGLRERDTVSSVMDFLHEPAEDRVGVLSGLRRTGKTTILRHTALRLSAAELGTTAVFLVDDGDSAEWARKALRKMKEEGCRIVFFDEFTRLHGYRATASSLADYYAGTGMKLLLSGTHSLGFRQLENEEWFDRARHFPTTHIPFAEWRRLVPGSDIESYMRHGGILSPMQDRGGRGFVVSALIGTYVNTAVCENILHALKTESRQYRYPLLRKMLREGRLEAAVRNIVLDEAHRIFPVTYPQDADVLPGEGQRFCNSLLALVEAESEEQIPSDERADLMADAAQSIGFSLREEDLESEETKAEAKGFFTDMDLMHPFPFRTFYPPFRPREGITSASRIRTLMETAHRRLEEREEELAGHNIMPQPGLRVSIITGLLEGLMKNGRVRSMLTGRATEFFDRAMSSTYGHMLEEIVLCDMEHIAERNGMEVFKAVFENGEYDMVVRDRTTKACGIYEIKHDTNEIRGDIDADPDEAEKIRERKIASQTRHLRDREKSALFEAEGNHIVSRTVLYRGAREMDVCGVRYRNVERFLEDVSNGRLDPVTGECPLQSPLPTAQASLNKDVSEAIPCTLRS